MTETEFAQSFARQLRERIVAQHGQEVAALLGVEWFDSVGVAVTEFAASVAASARREALEEKPNAGADRATVQVYAAALANIRDCTRDMWACSFAGHILRGKSLADSLKLAAKYDDGD